MRLKWLGWTDHVILLGDNVFDVYGLGMLGLAILTWTTAFNAKPYPVLSFCFAAGASVMTTLFALKYIHDCKIEGERQKLRVEEIANTIRLAHRGGHMPWGLPQGDWNRESRGRWGLGDEEERRRSDEQQRVLEDMLRW